MKVTGILMFDSSDSLDGYFTSHQTFKEAFRYRSCLTHDYFKLV